ncbi:MAG: hypothetical protein QM761_13555 [Pseudoxanthomonas sp.]
MLGMATAMPALAQSPGLGAEAAPACIEALLLRLGWRIETAPSPGWRIDGGDPCGRADLGQAQAAGDLRLRLPAGIDEATRAVALRAALNDPATRCAYLFELGAATRRATAALQGNPGYRFSGVQTGWIGFGVRGARAQGWQRFRSFGRGYRPVAGNARALDALYRGRVRAECGVGRQVAQLAAQRELYGDAAFDDEFAPGELSIGTFLTLHDTDSILLGRRAGELSVDADAAQAVRMGRQAFAGAPGAIVHALPLRYLDDINNQAENFVVFDVDDAAFAALRQAGGLAYYDRLNRYLWQLALRMPAGHHPRFFRRLLLERDARLRAHLDAKSREYLAQMEAVLADPFYGGFQVYVHRQGVRPVGEHLVRLLDLNPRTPFTIELVPHNLHGALYRRWMQRQLRDCAMQGGL